jgi:hypothetical protein
MRRKILLAVGLLVALLFVGAVLFKDAALYSRVLTPDVLIDVGAACKLASLGAGVVFATRCARLFDPGSPMRWGWLLMRAWFACFLVGQVVLTSYEVARGAPPVPSVGDPLFLAGYVAVTGATLRFVASYHMRSAALGVTRRNLVVAVVLAVVLGSVGVAFLGPVAHSGAPLFTRVVNVGYPVLDFILLVPTFVLLRIVYAFRGGRVWSVWATLLLGVMFFTAADIVYAIAGSASPVAARLSDLGYVLGYGFAAAGAGLEAELLDD